MSRALAISRLLNSLNLILAVDGKEADMCLAIVSLPAPCRPRRIIGGFIFVSLLRLTGPRGRAAVVSKEGSRLPRQILNRKFLVQGLALRWRWYPIPSQHIVLELICKGLCLVARRVNH